MIYYVSSGTLNSTHSLTNSAGCFVSTGTSEYFIQLIYTNGRSKLECMFLC